MTDEVIAKQITDSSWREAMRSINSWWSIDGPEEDKEKNILFAKGIFHSPTRDFERPIPLTMLEFTLKWSWKDKFWLEIDKYTGNSSPHNFKFDTRGNESIVWVSDKSGLKSISENNVTSFLNFYYNLLFDQSNFSFWFSAKRIPKK